MRRALLLGTAAGLLMAAAAVPRGVLAAEGAVDDAKAVLDDDAATKLVAQRDGPDANVRYEFRAGMNAKPSGGKEGALPLRIHCALYKITKRAGGGQAYERIDGTARFFVKDEAGKVVLAKSAPLGIMCPT